MKLKSKFCLFFCALLIVFLSGCGTVVKKYTNTELRGEVVSAAKLKDSPKVLKALELTKEGKEPWVAKFESAQGVIVSTEMKTFSKGFRLNMVSIKANTVSEIPVQEGDVVDIWMPPVSEASETGPAKLESIPVVRRVVCKKSAADYKECFNDPARGGEYGILDKETGKAANW